MATQTNLKITGTFGNAIFYKRGEGYFIRSKPRKNNQTTATKICSKGFGKANKLAATFRRMLLPVLPDSKIMDNMNKFQTAVYKWLLTDPLENTAPVNDVPFITGFEFNEQSHLTPRLKTALQTERINEEMLNLVIPPLNPIKQIVAPAYTQSIELCIAAGTCNVNTNVAIAQYSTIINIPYSNSVIPEQQVQILLPLSIETLAVVAVALRYTVMQKGNLYKTVEKRWMPASIVCAMYN